MITCSGLHNTGLDVFWEHVQLHRAKLSETGELAERRRDQQVRWMWSLLDDRLRRDLRSAPAVRDALKSLVATVRDGSTTPTAAADELWALYRSG